MIKIGVDNGNFNTKSSEGMLYSSGFSVSDSPTLSMENQLEHGGKYYSIGEGRMSVQPDKTVDDDVFLLTLPAIADAMRKQNVDAADIALGVGLPISLFGKQKERFGKYFLRDNINFAYAGREYIANIKSCQVFPQSYAALARYFTMMRSFSTLTLIDIGGYTVDIMRCRFGKADRDNCQSLPMGTITLFNNIKNELLKDNIRLNDTQITDGLFGMVEHLCRDHILEVLQRRCKEYAKNLNNAVREIGVDMKMPVALAGGGAERLEKYLRSSDIHWIGTLDKFANAEGYKVMML